jgi:hypothetical protein
MDPSNLNDGGFDLAASPRILKKTGCLLATGTASSLDFKTLLIEQASTHQQQFETLMVLTTH